MTLKIRKLNDKDYEELYQLLIKAEFPYLPSSKQKTIDVLSLSHNHLYGGFFNDKLVVFMCFSENASKLYFDIACHDIYRKRWGTKQTIMFIFDTAFNKLGYDEFYTESHTKTAQNAVEKLGFEKLSGFYYRLKAKSAVAKKYLKVKEKTNETNK